MSTRIAPPTAKDKNGKIYRDLSIFKNFKKCPWIFSQTESNFIYI